MKRIFLILLLGLIFSLGFFSYALAATIENIQINQEGNNLIVTWDAVPGAASYRVFNKETNQLFKDGNVGSNTTYTLNNAEAGKTYQFAIRAYKAGASNYFAGGDGEFTTLSAGTKPPEKIEIGAPFPGEPKRVDLIDHIYWAHRWASLVGTLVAVFMIIFAGFKYTTSAGNPEALQDAKDTLIGALIGLTMVILTYVLLQVVGVKFEKQPPPY